MGWREFTIEAIRALIWPSLAVWLVLNFKTEFRGLIARVSHFKVRDVEVRLEKIQEGSAVFEQVAQEDAPDLKIPIPLEKQISLLVDHSPAASILLAWTGVETALAEAVSRLAISPDAPSQRSVSHNVEMLEKYANMPPTLSETLHDMRRLRNDILHKSSTAEAITSQYAESFANSAAITIRVLNKLQRS